MRNKAYFLSADWNVSVLFQRVCARSWGALVGMGWVRQREKQYARRAEKPKVVCVCLWAMGPGY